jgi:hypothetical protein
LAVEGGRGRTEADELIHDETAAVFYAVRTA